MTTERTFPFDIDLWMNNRALRACSPAARGMWLDLLCMCYPTGYLPTLTDKQIARAIGETPAAVKKWMAELGSAGIFHVSEDDRLYSSRMVKAAESEAPMPAAPSTFTTPPAYAAQQASQAPVNMPPQTHHRPPLASADWWLTPAGWGRMGQQQAITIRDNEAYEEFQCRVSARLPAGPHLDVLSPGQIKRVEMLTPKQA